MATGHSTPFVRLPAGDTFTLIDEADAETLPHRRLKVNQDGYVFFYTSIRLALHRWIMRPPRHLVVDHINGDPLDNRRANLRVCTQAENLANGRSHRDSRSKFRGVSWRPKEGRWRAQISIGGQRSKFLGHWLTEEDAALAYDQAARERYGEFARLNFPHQEPSQAHRYLTREERRALGLPMKNVGGPGGLPSRAEALVQLPVGQLQRQRR